MSVDALPKATSYGYGEASQARMARKYRERATNHWRERIGLAERLVDQYAAPRLAKPASESVLADIGCSVGTFALEFAKKGYRAYGVDFDPKAIEWANRLAAEEGVAPRFLCMDVAEWRARNLPEIDVAICFDIFEHLHDDELGALLQGLRASLSKSGALVFSTTPTQYSYLHVGGSWRLAVLRALLLPFTPLGERGFERAVRVIAALADIALIALRARDHRELIKQEKHCNPLTRARLEDIFRRAGYGFLTLGTLNLHGTGRGIRAAFLRHPILHTHIVGVAVPA
ncbi:MAG: class I SAM-dependent methyltransferase [Alphaproteobacteria bacterium]